MDGTVIDRLVRTATKKWAKQRKQEERDRGAILKRKYAMRRRHLYSLKDAAFEVMEAAYMKASSQNTLPAHARQIMYAARGRILELTGESRLNDSYFTQKLLPDYMKEFPDETVGWDVVFDARGNLHEPHTARVVPLGTISVRQYLEETEAGVGDHGGACLPETVPLPTCGPENRYGAILFIEKEGFMPLLQRVRLADRYDVAIMSTKGLSVTASRRLVDEICAAHDIPLLVLHDFDKAGFSIVGTLTRDTRRYTFQNDIEVIDLGLRLEDIQAYGLEPEEVGLRSDPTENLLKNGATHEEAEYLGQGKRVELNAFASGDLVRWVESKLEGVGITKVVPDGQVLEQAYRSQIADLHVRLRMGRLIQEARVYADNVDLPGDLRQNVLARLDADRSLPWDAAVAAEARAN